MRKAFLLLILLLTAVGGVAAAQDVTATFCGTLSDADCAILTDSAAAMRDLQSAAFNFQLDANLADLPDEPSDVAVRLTGNGSYAVNSDALSALMLSQTEMMENIDQLPQLFEDAIKAISADATLVLYLPQNLPDTDQELPEKVGLSLRMVDGVGYINLDKLAELDTTGDLPRGWMGTDIAGFMRETLESQTGSLPPMSGTGTMNSEMMSAFSSPEFMQQFMTVERVDDVTLDGQNAAVFNQSIDVGAMFSSDEFQKMIREQLDASASSSGMSAQGMESILEIYSSLFKGFVVNTTQTIGLDDHFVHRFTLTLDWALDFDSMIGSFGGSGAKTPPINIHVSFEGSLSQFNNAPTITAPDDAQIIPLDKLLGRASL